MAHPEMAVKQQPKGTPMAPHEVTDDDGTVTVDYSQDGNHAVLTKDPDESHWRLEIEIHPFSFDTKDDINRAAQTVITAATDLLNRNAKDRA
jgi:hypothetical protein